MKDKQNTLESLVHKYLHLKKLRKNSSISIPEYNKKREAIIKAMAEFVGYKL